MPYALEADHATTADIATTATSATNATNATNVVTNANGTGRKICTGSTTPGSTAWQQYEATSYVRLAVDTSACGFTQTPRYFTSLGGAGGHWTAVGPTSIYAPTATGFEIYIYTAITPTDANASEWHINWMAVGE